ncbi:AtpZ/AtpI family protein [Hydrogenothermus marinus]|uniref:ATP synthase protein I n=1 Tax=Hydrogenothermus marinus TaxID=133270 RepID=A0A3M0BIG2_9AQUI|nr:AtpZ/AtpI family protein [Hydrogenothermus marinus]RMA97233.1 ATP synthase protein I [Hydrogenothermus marinus]
MSDFFKDIKEKINKLEQKKEKNIWYALTYIGSISIIFLLPVVLGAYIGWWLDGSYKIGKTSWTITGILIGIFIGIYNIYQIVYKKDIKDFK